LSFSVFGSRLGFLDNIGFGGTGFASGVRLVVERASPHCLLRSGRVQKLRVLEVVAKQRLCTHLCESLSRLIRRLLFLDQGVL
jgi:hypothetical protein